MTWRPALLLLLLLPALLWPLRLTLPPALDPFAPLDLEEPRTVLTGFKLWRLEHDPAACAAVLAKAPLRYRPVADRRSPSGCDLEGVVRLGGLDAVGLSSATLLTCPMTAALALLARDLRRLARELLGSPLIRLEHLGSYACRTVNTGQASARLSQHATANALDLTAFILEDGRRISVGADWRRDDARGRFLGAAHAAACRSFNTVLGPDYNALHRDHFHLDMGGFGLCR